MDELVDRSPILRTAAARELHLRGGVQVFEGVKQLAHAPRHEAREIAAFVLGQLGHPTCPFATDSFPILDTLLDDPYWDVRAQALVAIASLAMLDREPPDYIIRRFAERAHDDQREVRAAVANTALLLDRAVAEQILTVLAKDSDSGVRSIAEDELSELSRH